MPGRGSAFCHEIRHKRELVGLDPPVIHMSAYTTGGLKRLYKQISDPNVLNFPVYEHGQFTDKNGHFQPEPGCIMASRYRVQYILNNRGQSAVLLQAQDLFCKGKAVVIKVMHTGLYKLGAQETQCLQHLSQADPEGNSNTLKLQNTFTFDEHYCMVFQPLIANSLTEVFHDIPKEKIIVSIRKITLRLLTTLGFLKQQNIIHADLKPENILLRKKGNLQSVTVIDFGNAIHHVHKEIALYYDDFELQTPLYRAPEVIFGLPFGTEIDMWSLGCILAELYLGKPLFLGSSELDIVKEVTKLLGPFPSEIFQRGKFYHDLKSFTETCQQRDATEMIIKLFDCQDYAFADFIAGLLRFDPDERLNPYEAAQHSFLASELPIGYLLPLSAGKASSYPAVKISSEKYKHKPSIASHIKRSQPSSYDLLSMGTCSEQQTSARQHRTQIATVSPLLRKSDQSITKPLTADRYLYDGVSSDDSVPPLISIESSEQRSRLRSKPAFDVPFESCHVSLEQSVPVVRSQAQDDGLHHTSNPTYDGGHSSFDKVEIDQEDLMTCKTTRRNRSEQKHHMKNLTAVKLNQKYFIPNAEIQVNTKKHFLPAQSGYLQETKPSSKARSKYERQTGTKDTHSEVALVRDHRKYPDEPYRSISSDSSGESAGEFNPVCRTKAFSQQPHKEEDNFHHSQKIKIGLDHGENTRVRIKRNKDSANFAPVVLFENGVMKASNPSRTQDTNCNKDSKDENVFVNVQKDYKCSFSAEFSPAKASKERHSLTPSRDKDRITLKESPPSPEVTQDNKEDNVNVGKNSGTHRGNLKSIMNMIMQEQAKVENDLQENMDDVDIQHINRANSAGRWAEDIGNKKSGTNVVGNLQWPVDIGNKKSGTDVVEGHQMHHGSLHKTYSTQHSDQSNSRKRFIDEDYHQLEISSVEDATCDIPAKRHTADAQGNKKSHRMDEKRVKYLGRNIYADEKRTTPISVTELRGERKGGSPVTPSSGESHECLSEGSIFTREKPRKSTKKKVVMKNRESDRHPLAFYTDDQSLFLKKTSREHKGLSTKTVSESNDHLISPITFHQDSKFHHTHNTNNYFQNVKEFACQANEKIISIETDRERNLTNSVVSGISPKVDMRDICVKPSKTESVVTNEERYTKDQKVCNTRCDFRNDKNSSGSELKIHRTQKWRQKLHFTKALVPRKHGSKQQKINRRMKRKEKETDEENLRATDMGCHFDESGWSGSKVKDANDPYNFVESPLKKNVSQLKSQYRNGDEKFRKGNVNTNSLSSQSERTKQGKTINENVSTNFFKKDATCVDENSKDIARVSNNDKSVTRVRNKLSFKKSSDRKRDGSLSAHQDVKKTLGSESIQSSEIVSDVLLDCDKKRIVSSFNSSEKKQSISSRRSGDRQTRKRNTVSSFLDEENTGRKRHKLQTHDDERNSNFYSREMHVISDEASNTNINKFINEVDSYRHCKTLNVCNRKSLIGEYQEMDEVDGHKRKSHDFCERTSSVAEYQEMDEVDGHKRKSLDFCNRKSLIGEYQEMDEVNGHRHRKSPDICSRKSLIEEYQEMDDHRSRKSPEVCNRKSSVGKYQESDEVDSHRRCKSSGIYNRKSSIEEYDEIDEVDDHRHRKSPADVCNRKSVGEYQQMTLVICKPNVYVTAHAPTTVSSISTKNTFKSRFSHKTSVHGSMVNTGSKMIPSRQKTFDPLTRVTSVKGSKGNDSSDSDQEILLIPSPSHSKTNTMEKQNVEVRCLYGTDVDGYSSDNSSEMELL